MKDLIKKRSIPALFIGLGSLLLFSALSFGQSKTAIYSEDGRLLNASQLEFKKEHVVYQNPNLRMENTNRIFNEDILLCFYPLGTYHVYDKSSKDLVKVPYTIGGNSVLDKIITDSEEVLAGEIESIKPAQIKYFDPKTGKDKTLEKSKAVAILHRNGDYNIYGEVDQVAKILLKVKDKIFSLESEASLVNNTEGEISEEVVLNYPEENASAPVDKEDFKNKALSKTKELENYLHFIAGKQTDKFKSAEAIESAVQLFLSEDNIIQVSSIDRVTNEQVIIKRKIREYLTRLKLLKYDKVKISWSDISYVSDIQLGESGNYYGVIVLKQKFEGYVDGKLKYTDITTKRMTVILKTYEKYVAGEKQVLWDVFLGDIGVMETT